MRRLLSLAVLCLAPALQAAPQDAVVRIISHGGSGTVIYSVPGRTLVLSCGHAFETGADRARPIVLNSPHPRPAWERRRVGVRLLALDFDGRERDLSLVELRDGPAPYVCRVAPAGHRPGPCWSVGYDTMRLPAVVRPATIYATSAAETYTREPPVPGRSGGALVDQRTGWLVGVVVAYRFDPHTRRPTTGVYVSHSAVLAFLGRHAPEAIGHARAPFAPAWPAPRSPLPPLCPT